MVLFCMFLRTSFVLAFSIFVLFLRANLTRVLVFSSRLREDENEVTYTETDCVAGLPMFRGDMAVKTTYRVTRSEEDPDNSVHVKVRGP